LFDNRRAKRIFCVDWQEDSEIDVMCTNIRNYVHLFSGRGEAHEGFTVEDNRKHNTRQSYRDDDKLWQSQVSVHKTLAWRFIKDYAARQDQKREPKNLGALYLEFTWCAEYLTKLKKLKNSDVAENYVQPDFFPDTITKNQATPEMTFKFIEETVLQPMIDADVGCDLLIIKVRIHPDVLDTCTDGKSILMRDYTLVNALQVIPHAQGRSIIYDAIQDRSIIMRLLRYST
jgi:hypothetical protein